MTKLPKTLGLFAACALAAIADPEARRSLLSLDFSQADSIGAQSELGLPDLTPVMDVFPSQEDTGAADFGVQGVLQWDSFRHPTGPFTVEAGFFVREYGPESTRYISDLINSATWDNGPIQGLTLRLGGGYLYPVLPEKAYSDPERYHQSLSRFTNSDRASLSRCLGAFAIGAKSGGTAPWLEAYTDRCVERGRWNHLVGVWDGEKARIYLNGRDATDSLRLNGAGSRPNLDSIAPITIGGRNEGSFDQRHFDGRMDFARILDTAMGEMQIRGRYQEVLPPAPADGFCRGVAIPVAPAAGEACEKDAKFTFMLTVFGACTDPWAFPVFGSDYSVDAEFSRDAEFEEILLRLRVAGDSIFSIDSLLSEKGGSFSGPIYWRVRLISLSGDALPKTAALAKSGAMSGADSDWSEPKPMFLTYALPASPVLGATPGPHPRLLAVPGGYRLEGWTGPGKPQIFGLDGKAAPMAIARGADGSWSVSAGRNVLAGSARVYLLKTSRGAMLLLF